MDAFAFASGGFPNDGRNPFRRYPDGKPRPILLLHQALPSLDHPLMEGGSLIALSPDNPSPEHAVLIDSEKGVWFFPESYKSMLGRDLEALLIAARSEAERSKTKLWLKIPPLAAMVWTYLPFGTSIGDSKCVEYFSEALSGAVLALEGAETWLGGLELPDFTPEGSYRLSDEAVKHLEGMKISVRQGKDKSRDLLAFDADETEFRNAVAIGGSCFAMPGNQRDYSTLESMVANNTTMRRDGSWVFNPFLLDPRNYIPIVRPVVTKTEPPRSDSE